VTKNKGIIFSLDSMCSFPSVTLADSFIFSAQGIEIANATFSLSLSFVIYVPSFPLSLLSVSRITRALNCSVTFYPTFCEFQFQELEMKKMIGIGHEKDGLYYQDLISKPVACSSSVSLFDYHCRLGHPLYQF